MRESTQITYGEGIVNVELSSESLSEIPAPTFRFGNYEQVLDSCFTQKELGEIYEGDHANLTFSFVMSDEPNQTDEYETLSKAAVSSSRGIGKFSEGVVIKMNAAKSVGGGDEVRLDSLSGDVELQVEIPMYLIKQDRNYYFITDSLGACKLYMDLDADDSTLTVNTSSIGTSMILYRDIPQELVRTDGSHFKISPSYVFLLIIAMLLIFWHYVTGIHKNKKT